MRNEHYIDYFFCMFKCMFTVKYMFMFIIGKKNYFKLCNV